MRHLLHAPWRHPHTSARDRPGAQAVQQLLHLGHHLWLGVLLPSSKAAVGLNHADTDAQQCLKTLRRHEHGQRCCLSQPSFFGTQAPVVLPTVHLVLAATSLPVLPCLPHRNMQLCVLSPAPCAAYRHVQ
jgi:hypothetical protein